MTSSPPILSRLILLRATSLLFGLSLPFLYQPESLALAKEGAQEPVSASVMALSKGQEREGSARAAATGISSEALPASRSGAGGQPDADAHAGPATSADPDGGSQRTAQPRTEKGKGTASACASENSPRSQCVQVFLMDGSAGTGESGDDAPPKAGGAPDAIQPGRPVVLQRGDDLGWVLPLRDHCFDESPCPIILENPVSTKGEMLPMAQEMSALLALELFQRHSLCLKDDEGKWSKLAGERIRTCKEPREQASGGNGPSGKNGDEAGHGGDYFAADQQRPPSRIRLRLDPAGDGFVASLYFQEAPDTMSAPSSDFPDGDSGKSWDDAGAETTSAATAGASPSSALSDASKDPSKQGETSPSSSSTPADPAEGTATAQVSRDSATSQSLDARSDASLNDRSAGAGDMVAEASPNSAGTEKKADASAQESGSGGNGVPEAADAASAPSDPPRLHSVDLAGNIFTPDSGFTTSSRLRLSKRFQDATELSFISRQLADGLGDAMGTEKPTIFDILMEDPEPPTFHVNLKLGDTISALEGFDFSAFTIRFDLEVDYYIRPYLQAFLEVGLAFGNASNKSGGANSGGEGQADNLETKGNFRKSTRASLDSDEGDDDPGQDQDDDISGSFSLVPVKFGLKYSPMYQHDFRPYVGLGIGLGILSDLVSANERSVTLSLSGILGVAWIPLNHLGFNLETSLNFDELRMEGGSNLLFGFTLNFGVIVLF